MEFDGFHYGQAFSGEAAIQDSLAICRAFCHFRLSLVMEQGFQRRSRDSG